MVAQRQVISGEKIVDGDNDLGELSTRLGNVRKQIKTLTAIEDALVAELRVKLGVESTKRAVPSSVAGTVNGVAVVAASSFTRVTVDGNKLRRLYPEIYASVTREAVVTSIRSQLDDED